MKVQILGKNTRQSTNQNGQVRYYTNLFFVSEFTPAEKESGALGNKCDVVNTMIDCSSISVGDVVNFDYGPTGYKNSDGSPQIRLLSIDVLEKSK